LPRFNVSVGGFVFPGSFFSLLVLPSPAPAVTMEDRSVGAYVFALKNTSKRTLKDLECHLESGATSSKLTDGGITAPQGMKYTVAE
jgi:hypothetical protein